MSSEIVDSWHNIRSQYRVNRKMGSKDKADEGDGEDEADERDKGDKADKQE